MMRFPFVTREHHNDVVRLLNEKIQELKAQLGDMAECVVEKSTQQKAAIETRNATIERRNGTIDVRPKETEEPTLPFDHTILKRPGRFSRMISGSRARDYNGGRLKNMATRMFDNAVAEGQAAARAGKAAAQEVKT